MLKKFLSVITIMGMVAMVSCEMENISKEDSNLIYFRFQPEIQEASNDLNDSSAKNSRALLNDADRYILENSNKFDRLFSLMKIKMEYL